MTGLIDGILTSNMDVLFTFYKKKKKILSFLSYGLFWNEEKCFKVVSKAVFASDGGT